MNLVDWFKGRFKNSEKSDKRVVWIDSSGQAMTYGQVSPYVSDIVNNAIERRATEVSKLELRSIVEKNGSVTVVNDTISRLFRFAPNPVQTTADFLANIEWQRLKTGNAFVYPQYEWVDTAVGRIKRFMAFWVLKSQAVNATLDDNGNIVYQIFVEDGKSYPLPASEVVKIPWRRGTNPYFGGDDNGALQTGDMGNAVSALNEILTNLPKSLKSSMGISGMYVPAAALGSDKLAKAREDLEAHIFSSKSGIVATDLVGTFTPTNNRPVTIPPDTMNFIKGTVCERYGVSLEVLAGNATDEQHEAFYQTAIEDFIIQLEQAFAPVLYTQREQDVGHKLRAYYSRLKKLSVNKTLEIAKHATDTGTMSIDTILDLFGMEPLPNGEGKVRIRSLNFIDASKANLYQVGAAAPTEPEGGDQNEPGN